MAKRSKGETDVETLAEQPPVEGPKRKFVVTFNPSTPIGERAARMEVEANNADKALQIWRESTGFLGATSVPPVVTEAN